MAEDTKAEDIRAEALQWPEPEGSELLQFQKSLWELASAITAEHALSLPVDRKKNRTSPALPAHEPDWLIDEAPAAAPASAAIPPTPSPIPEPVNFALACEDLDGLIAQLDDTVLNKKD